MEHHGPTSWLLMIPGLSHDPRMIGVNASLLLFVFIVVLSLIGRAAISGPVSNYIVPSPKAKLVTLIDLLVEGLYNMCTATLGPSGKEHFPFIASLFIYVWFGNLMGLLPLSASPNAKLYSTAALGISTFVYYNVHGIRAHGLVGYMKHFLMGMGIAGIPIAVVEIFSHVLRPVTLLVRLNLNIQIDHLLGEVFGSMFAYLLPVPLMFLGIVVCTIQAFLFATLTSVYLQMATEHEHEHEHEAEHHHSH